MPTAVFAGRHEFPKNPSINVTDITGVGQARCDASIPTGSGTE